MDTHPDCIYHSNLESGKSEGDPKSKSETKAFRFVLTIILALRSGYEAGIFW